MTHYPTSHSYTRPPHQHAPPAPPVPLPEVDALRRMCAALVDICVAGALGALIAFQAVGETGTGAYWAALVGSWFGVSFVNQVVLTWITRVSVGKFVFFLRVVRDPGDWFPPHGFLRARFWRLVQRWLLGLCYLPILAVQSVFQVEDEPEDACRVRLIRRRDLVYSR